MSATQMLRLAARVALVLWGLFWTAFAVAEGVSGGDRAWIHVAEFAGPIVGLVVLAFLRPRWGGVALMAGGVFAACFFRHPFVEATLALPATLIGLALLIER